MSPRSRRFNLGDLMILVAASAMATMALRELWQGLTTGDGARYWDGTPGRLLIAAALSACAGPLTLAGLAFRLRRPRPPWRRLAIQPGTAALIACSVAFVMRSVELAASMRWPRIAGLGGVEFARVSTIRFGEVSLVLIRSLNGNGVIGQIEPIGCFGVTVTTLAPSCGPAVAATWAVLALSGRWRPERSWIDRSGRLLGVAWIVTALLSVLPAR